MKIALAQLNFQIGNFKLNTTKIIDHIQKAKSFGADLIVFPELALTAYPPHDFLEFDHFIVQCEKSIQEISKHCDGIAAVVGAPYRNPDKGKKLYNSAYFLNNKKVEDVIHKTLLPTYDIFDEYRYFEPNKQLKIISYKGYNISITICEDLWNIYTPFYTKNPMDELSKLSPDFIINIAASPFSYQHNNDRIKVLQKNALQYNLPVFYVNHVGAQTEILFDGSSKVVDEKGQHIAEMAKFKEDFQVFDVENLKVPKSLIMPTKYEIIHDALVMGIKDYFTKLGFKKAILGLSGGIDSALVLVLLQRALGAENVKALLLPSMFSSSHSIEDATQLALNLGVSYEIISITNIYDAINHKLEPYFEGTEFGIAEENIQSRTRALLLMAYSNKFGNILINTSNKSELAVGYGTLYGDMCGGISVIGDLYKTEVFELCRFINKDQEVIPDNIITKPPSAELKPDQKDSDSLPDYEILDQILYHYIDEQKGFDEIIDLGFDENLVRKILNMVNINEHKRYQSPPVLRISNKSFGIGRRMPIVAKYEL